MKAYHFLMGVATFAMVACTNLQELSPTQFEDQSRYFRGEATTAKSISQIQGIIKADGMVKKDGHVHMQRGDSGDLKVWWTSPGIHKEGTVAMMEFIPAGGRTRIKMYYPQGDLIRERYIRNTLDLVQ